MRMDIAKRDVTVTGGGNDIKVRIASNAKAFKALIDKLYSDKPRAVIRELWSNALDAHGAVGTPERPFHSHLPTVYEPWFSVRDFGPGMDAKFVEGLYSTVFESTKDQDNNAVGKWGLGSKSPWAYTDAFTVTCYDGQVMRSYTAYIDEDQFPNFKLMLETASTEPRGVEVKVPVKLGDIRSFTEAAQRVALGFDIKPVVNLDTMPNIIEQATQSGDGWYYINSKNDYRYDVPELSTELSYVWQGCVLYPIDTALIKDLTPEADVILGGGFIIRVPIGSVDINPAREGLSYDKQTIEYIKKTVVKIASELVRDYQARIDEAKTYYAACATMSEILIGFDGSSIKRILRNRLVYRGKGLSEEVSLNSVLSRYSNLTFENGGIAVMCMTTRALWGRTYPPRMRGYTFAFQPAINLTVPVSPSPVIIWEDPNATIKTAARRFDAYFNAHRDGNVLWVRCNRNSMAFKRLLVLLNKRPDDVIELSSLAYQKDTTGTERRTPVMAKKLVPGGWESTTVNTSSEIIYVPLHRNEIVEHPTIQLPVYSLTTLYKYFDNYKAATGNTQPNLIGIPKTLSGLVNKGEKWRDFRDVIAEMLNNVPQEFNIAMTNVEALNSIHTDVRSFFDEVRAQNRSFVTGTALHNIYVAYCSLVDRVRSSQAFVDMWCNFIRASVNSAETYYTIDKSEVDFWRTRGAAVLASYPMLRHVQNFRDSRALVDTINYVNTITPPPVDLSPVLCDTSGTPDQLDQAA